MKNKNKCQNKFKGQNKYQNKFEIGDVVRMKKYLRTDKYYGHLVLLDDMRFKGERVIRSVSKQCGYLVNVIDNSFYFYSYDMLELVK